MASTIIDSLILALELDPSSFSKGQKEAVDGLLKTKDASEKAAKDIERNAKSAEQFVGKLRNQVIALFAAFTAGKGLKEFVSDITASDAATGRLSKTLNMSVNTVSKWQGAAKLVGGTAEGVAGSMQSLTQQLQQFSLTGESATIPYFRALGIGIVEANGKLKTADKLLLELASSFSKLDPARAATFGSALGLDQGTINLLLQGRSAVEAMLREQEKLGVIDEKNTKAAQALQKAWGSLVQSSTTLGRELLTSLTPALIKAVDALTSLAVWAQDHPALVETVFFGLATAITAFSTALTIGLTGSSITSAVAGIGLITTAVKALTVALLTNPLVVAVLATGALGYMAYDTYQNWESRNPFRDRGGPASGRPLPVGSVQQRMQQERDKQALVGMGWSPAQATGIVANIQRESAGNASAVGDGGKAFGLAQWHPDRQANFKKWAGVDIRQASRAQQLAFINYELRHGTEQKAGKALMGATDAGSAAAIVSSQYERPANGAAEAQARAALAVAMSKSSPSAINTARGAMPSSHVANDNRSSTSTMTSETHIGQITINTKAEDAKGIAATIGPAVKNNSFAAQANYGPN